LVGVTEQKSDGKSIAFFLDSLLDGHIFCAHPVIYSKQSMSSNVVVCVGVRKLTPSYVLLRSDVDNNGYHKNTSLTQVCKSLKKQQVAAINFVSQVGWARFLRSHRNLYPIVIIIEGCYEINRYQKSM
jgi:hypothetical protein